MILIFSWIAKQPPIKPYGPLENMYFSGTNCTKKNVHEFRIEYNNKVMHHPEALVVGSISSTKLGDKPHDSVPEKVQKWIHIISKETAKYLLYHRPYDHTINFKIG
jgi:hypothetical protein